MKLSAQQTQETLTLLKILALGQTKIAEGKVKSLDQAVREIKAGAEAPRTPNDDCALARRA
jgi:hypothetical protein